jgi:hypothetical protein
VVIRIEIDYPIDSFFKKVVDIYFYICRFCEVIKKSDTFENWPKPYCVYSVSLKKLIDSTEFGQ